MSLVVPLAEGGAAPLARRNPLAKVLAAAVLAVTLLVTLDPSRLFTLPVYFRMLNVHAVTRDSLPSLVRDQLRDVKRRRDEAAPTR